MSKITLNYVTIVNKTFFARLEQYMECRLVRKSVQMEYANQIAEHTAKIESLKKCFGSSVEKQAKQDIAEHMLAIDALREECSEAQKKAAVFEFTDGDKTLRKAVKDCDKYDTAVVEAVKAWASNYGVDLDNTKTLDTIIGRINTKDNFDRLVDTDGKNIFGISASNVLDTVYKVLWTEAVASGVIPAASIPEIIYTKYGKEAREARLAAKKAKKAKKAA